MTVPPEDDPPPNLVKFQKRPKATGGNSQQRNTIGLAICMVLLVATALIWHRAVR